MREVAEAFVLGFVLGVSALVVVGSEIAKELRSVKTELAGTLDVWRGRLKAGEPKSCIASSPGYRAGSQAGGSARQDLADSRAYYRKLKSNHDSTRAYKR